MKLDMIYIFGFVARFCYMWYVTVKEYHADQMDEEMDDDDKLSVEESLAIIFGYSIIWPLSFVKEAFLYIRDRFFDDD